MTAEKNILIKGQKPGKYTEIREWTNVGTLQVSLTWLAPPHNYLSQTERKRYTVHFKHYLPFLGKKVTHIHIKC